GIGYNCDKCSTDPMFTSTGILWSSADPRFPMAQLPAYAANVDHRDDLLPFDGASMNKDKQSDARTALKFDARYEVSGLFDYVKGGFKYLKSEREYDATPIWEGDLSGTPLAGKSLAASGLVERQVDGFFKDRYYYGSILSRDRVIAAVNAARAANPVTYSTADLNKDDKNGSETIYAGYALAHLQSGSLEVVGGARVEHTKVETTTWISDATTSGFGKTNRDYTNVLPSITAVYRQGEALVYRGAIWTSFSRPEYSNISRGESVTRDPATKEIIAISRGNPDLKPGESVNFDVSAEWYPDRSSVVSIGVFHKKMKNFIFTDLPLIFSSTRS
ncbi:TonB-dependent receptor domain-containing protein, partial [Caulobacter sp. CCH5-E12]|uniref:TonB-dependent receptor domain-containing protein n=1 Tax=Caulobacter sp. CCH5-E12 TaxID=1768770 RepID=UPI000AC08F9C